MVAKMLFIPNSPLIKIKARENNITFAAVTIMLLGIPKR